MPASLRDLPCCAQCGQPMDSQAAAVGCLHCLLGEMLDEGLPASTREPARFHHYELCRHEDGSAHELGRGAMGVTYKALDVNLQVPVALKVINPRYSAHPQARERFLREARAAARLRHPNVATVYHYGTTDSDAGLREVAAENDPAGNHCFYAMEFIEGETLEARLRRTGPLPVPMALEIARQVATALEAAEKRGLVHRDLKPANLMLATDEGAAWVKVIDFGLAKAVGAAGGEDERGMVSTVGGFVGTPQFASPEQFERVDVDVRSDVYSLGTTLWYALTGRAPYEGATPAAVHDRQVHRPLPVAQLTDHGVPAAVVELLSSMLAPDPARRPASAGALRMAIEQCLTAVTLTRSRLWHPFGPAIVALGLAGLATLVSGLVWWHSHKIHPTSPTAVAGDAKSVAILPFENRSAQPDNDYFADGVQDEILSLLAKVSGLKVISRGSVARYARSPNDLPEVARQLGVANLVEGSVQKVGERVHVHVQLIQAASGTQLWADSYDLKLDDLFTMESRVAHGVADALAVRLTGAEQRSVALNPTVNPDAYDAYLRGLTFISHPTLHTTDILAAQRFFGEAVRLDSNFALAWAQLSLVHSWGYCSGWVDGTPALREAARVAADNALRLQPHLGEALLATGYYHAACLADQAGALEFYARATAFLPNSSTIPQYRAEIATTRGEWDKALRQYDDARRLDPRNVRLLTHRAALLCNTRRFADALHAYDDILQIVPGDPETINNQAYIYLATGNLARAELLQAGLHPGPDDGNIIYCQVVLDWAQRHPERAVARLTELLTHRAEMKATSAAGWLGMLGRSQKLAGDPTASVTLHDARRELEILLATQPDNAFLTTDVARVCAAQGDHDAALAAARRAMTLIPAVTDANMGRSMEDVFAETAAQVGEPDLAIATLTRLRHASYEGALAGGPVTGAMLRLYPMFDALRGDARFQALCQDD